MNHPLLHALAFSQMHGVNAYLKAALIKKYGSAYTIYQERQKGSDAFKNLEPNARETILAAWPFNAANAELAVMSKNGIDAICLEDPAYPNRLYQCEDAPSLLFLKGSKKWNLPQLVSIVGTRNHSMYAEKVIHELLEGLAHLNLGIVSGLALGIDGMVHQKACQLNMPNWGVTATGLDSIYPTQHQALANKLLKCGGLISENPSATPPLPFQFPKRNRIVAGMADVTIVIESAIHGGSMITAGLARGYHREVFAVPGKIFDPKSKGCLALMQSNTAQIYQSPTQLLEFLGWALAESKGLKQQALAFTLSPICQEILRFIAQQSPIHRDQLANRFNLNIALLSTHLLTLELNGLILPHGGAFYSIR